MIAAVNGPAIGAGMQLAVACDFRVAGSGRGLRRPGVEARHRAEPGERAAARPGRRTAPREGPAGHQPLRRPRRGQPARPGHPVRRRHACRRDRVRLGDRRARADHGAVAQARGHALQRPRGARAATRRRRCGRWSSRRSSRTTCRRASRPSPRSAAPTSRVADASAHSERFREDPRHRPRAVGRVADDRPGAAGRRVVRRTERDPRVAPLHDHGGSRRREPDPEAVPVAAVAVGRARLGHGGDGVRSDDPAAVERGPEAVDVRDGGRQSTVAAAVARHQPDVGTPVVEVPGREVGPRLVVGMEARVRHARVRDDRRHLVTVRAAGGAFGDERQHHETTVVVREARAGTVDHRVTAPGRAASPRRPPGSPPERAARTPPRPSPTRRSSRRSRTGARGGAPP